MKETVIPVVISFLGTVTMRFLMGLEDLEIKRGEDTILTIALLRSTRILRRVLGTRGDLLTLKLPVEDHQLMLM